MIKKVAWAQVRVPDYPRVRFFQKSPEGGGKVIDVTEKVTKLELEENGNGVCVLVRLDSDDKVLWKTHHPSLQEAKWHCEFEYGLPDDKWVPAE